MQLQDVIAVLRKAVEERGASYEVQFGFCNPHSYRGYYRELAFEPSGTTTIGSMLEAAEGADGATYEGWKGGDFTMSDYSDCHIAVEGDCGEELSPLELAFMLESSYLPDEAITRIARRGVQ